jgi:hypothetical protein
MRYQVYLKRRGRWRRLLRYVGQAGVPYVLEVGELDTSRSPVAAALEFEEMPPEALVLPRAAGEEFDWYVMFADALGVRRLVLPPLPALDEVAAIYDKAVTKEIYRTIVALSGYMREIYLSNRRGEWGPRLPPFDPIGRINYVEVLQALYLIQWDGRATIRQAPQFFGELDLQLRIGAEVLETARSVGVSKKVQKRVAEIFNELMT